MTPIGQWFLYWVAVQCPVGVVGRTQTKHSLVDHRYQPAKGAWLWLGPTDTRYMILSAVRDRGVTEVDRDTLCSLPSAMSHSLCLNRDAQRGLDLLQEVVTSDRYWGVYKVF